MRVTLIHNPGAGSAAPEEEVMNALASISWRVERRLTKSELDEVLHPGSDVVVVAAGDGMVGKVARRLAGSGLPMAILPMGTANNVARSLGLELDPRAAALGLSDAVERRIDLGVVTTSTGRRELFLEGFGIGVFADVVADKANKQHKALHKAMSLIADQLEGNPERRIEIVADGVDLSGSYVLAAVMNTRSLGPAINVAPAAECDAGELDVVLAVPEAKAELATHLRRAAVQGDVARPALRTMRARRVRIRAEGTWAHVDDAARELRGEVSVDVADVAVTLLAPRRSTKRG